MEESLKSLRWSLLALNAGCLSIGAALVSTSGESTTVTIMSFTVPVQMLLVLGYLVVLLLQAQVHLHLRHISRLAEAGIGVDRLGLSPVIAMHANHGDTSIESFLSYALLAVQLVLLPIFSCGSLAVLSAGVVWAGLANGVLQSVLYLFPLAMLAVTILTACRSHRMFKSLCARLATLETEETPQIDEFRDQPC